MKLARKDKALGHDRHEGSGANPVSGFYIGKMNVVLVELRAI